MMTRSAIRPIAVYRTLPFPDWSEGFSVKYLIYLGAGVAQHSSDWQFGWRASWSLPQAGSQPISAHGVWRACGVLTRQRCEHGYLRAEH